MSLTDYNKKRNFRPEVKKGLRITDFTIKNAVALLEERGDLFKGVLGPGIDMPTALEKLEAEWGRGGTT